MVEEHPRAGCPRVSRGRRVRVQVRQPSTRIPRRIGSMGSELDVSRTSQLQLPLAEFRPASRNKLNVADGGPDCRRLRSPNGPVQNSHTITANCQQEGFGAPQVSDGGPSSRRAGFLVVLRPRLDFHLSRRGGQWRRPKLPKRARLGRSLHERGKRVNGGARQNTLTNGMSYRVSVESGQAVAESYRRRAEDATISLQARPNKGRQILGAKHRGPGAMVRAMVPLLRRDGLDPGQHRPPGYNNEQQLTSHPASPGASKTPSSTAATGAPPARRWSSRQELSIAASRWRPAPDP